MKMKKQENVIVYLRMSSDLQTDSIEKQRQEINRVVIASGYNVVRTYIDEGLSGSKDTHLRIGFNQMLSDISTGNVDGATCLVVWKTSRFSREFPFESMTFYNVLHKAKLNIHCTKLGRHNLKDQSSRFQIYFAAEQNHGYSVELGDNSAGGRRALASAGWWVTGNIPYGYDKCYVSPSGETLQGGRLDKTIRKPTASVAGAWHCKLVANPIEAERVRLAFELRASGYSLRSIADEFNRLGYSAPSGKEGAIWTHSNFRDILTNPVYTGCSVVGRGGRNRKSGGFSQIDCLIVESEKVATIVSRADWEAVQNSEKRLKKSASITKI